MNQRSPRTPRQSRSIKTVSTILDAAVAILADQGYEGLNTNTVAREAGVNISTLYSYFPNKEAILEQLLERYNEQLIGDVQKELAKNPDRHDRVGVLLAAQVEQIVREPWMGAFKRALATAPALADLQARANTHLAETVIRQIPPEVAGPKLSGQHQQVVMQLLVSVQNHGTQLIVNAPEALRPALLAEVTLLINSYLDNYR